MQDWTAKRRGLYGCWLGMSLGVIAGALELLLAFSGQRLPLHFGEVLGVGVVLAAVMGGVGFVLGGACSLWHRARLAWPVERAFAYQLAGVTLGLSAIHFVPMGIEMHGRGHGVVGLAMAGMSVGFAAVVMLNTRYWIRRSLHLASPGLAWWWVSGGVSVVLILLGSVLGSRIADTGVHALEGDRSVLLVTAEGVSWDAPLGLEPGTAVRFLEAVTPSPVARPAHATVLTGLHPLRHRVVMEDDALSWGHTTLPEVLREEGYATGAFVSTAALDVSGGLGQGFSVYDDDFSTVLPGWRQTAVAGWWRTLGVGGGAAQARDARQTTDRAVRWLERVSGGTWMAWVQLAERPGGPDVATEVARLLEAVAAEDVLVLVVGTMGPGGGGPPLRDAAIHVPLWFKDAALDVQHPEVSAQVRLMDVAPTLIDALELPELDRSEGTSLIGYATGERAATMWCSLVQPDEEGEVWIGMRNNGLKYIESPGGARELYVLDEDPDEAHDVAYRQPETLARAVRLLDAEQTALHSLLEAR